MKKHTAALALASLLFAASALAKDKTKPTLPTYILQAKTIAVLIDPDAGISIEDPQANRVAQKDVETALLNWGRFQVVTTTQTADLLVVVKRGHRMVDRTISDPRQNSRPGVIDPTDTGILVGAQRGQPPPLSGDPSGQSTNQQVHSQAEIGSTQDSFLIYNGDDRNPLDAAPTWRYMAVDALRPHSVPAVAEFRKAVAEAEKAAARHP